MAKHNFTMRSLRVDGKVFTSQEDLDAYQAGDSDEIDATPDAKELADENGIDLASIEGTGKDGRILKSDVQSAIE